jgi:hypothetical protein
MARVGIGEGVDLWQERKATARGWVREGKVEQRISN